MATKDTKGSLMKSSHQPLAKSQVGSSSSRRNGKRKISPADPPTDWLAPLPRLRDPAGLLAWAQAGAERLASAPPVLTVDSETGRVAPSSSKA